MFSSARANKMIRPTNNDKILLERLDTCTHETTKGTSNHEQTLAIRYWRYEFICSDEERHQENPEKAASLDIEKLNSDQITTEACNDASAVTKIINDKEAVTPIMTTNLLRILRLST